MVFIIINEVIKMFKEEIIANKILPAIRKLICKKLKKEKMSQLEIAEILDITPAAVSQYISGKRGNFKLPKETINFLNSNLEEGICVNRLIRKTIDQMIKFRLIEGV